MVAALSLYDLDRDGEHTLSPGANGPQLLEGVTLAGDTLLLYTSDHGQMMDGGPTHCRYDPAALAQWRVPMLAMGEGVARMPGLAANATCWNDAASHHNLRAAALEAMGYDDHSAQPGGFASLSRCDRPAAAPLVVGALPFPTAAREALRFKCMPLQPAGTP